MFRSEGFQKYFKNFSWLFVERILRLALILGTTIVVSRYLGAEDALQSAQRLVQMARTLQDLIRTWRQSQSDL